MEFEIVQADQSKILELLDDDLFFNYIKKEQLEEQLQLSRQGGVDTDVDQLVTAALERALNITITEGDTIYTTRRTTKL